MVDSAVVMKEVPLASIDKEIKLAIDENKYNLKLQRILWV